jgi:hypothetical protein
LMKWLYPSETSRLRQFGNNGLVSVTPERRRRQCRERRSNARPKKLRV